MTIMEINWIDLFTFVVSWLTASESALQPSNSNRKHFSSWPNQRRSVDTLIRTNRAASSRPKAWVLVRKRTNWMGFEPNFITWSVRRYILNCYVVTHYSLSYFFGFHEEENIFCMMCNVHAGVWLTFRIGNLNLLSRSVSLSSSFPWV